jgi:hypothetical protein
VHINAASGAPFDAAGHVQIGDGHYCAAKKQLMNRCNPKLNPQSIAYACMSARDCRGKTVSICFKKYLL